MVKQQDITGLILAGGAGRRLNGRDKGLLIYRGVSLIEQQINWFKPQLKAILISANRNIELYRKTGYLVLQDQTGAFDGPLTGILKGLVNCPSHWLFVQPIDVPNLPADTIEKLLAKVQLEADSNCYYLKSDQREHYLSMLINKQCLPSLVNYLHNGHRKVRDFHKMIKSAVIDIELTEIDFQNLNHCSDYQ